jgi:hypothetical protein
MRQSRKNKMKEAKMMRKIYMLFAPFFKHNALPRKFWLSRNKAAKA